MTDYNHKNGSKYSVGDCAMAVGKRATLTFTGEIIDSGHSDNGAFVKFLVDERWGFGRYDLTLDLDALDIVA